VNIALLRPLYGSRPWEADQAGENAIINLIARGHNVVSITKGDTYIHEARTKLAKAMLRAYADFQFEWILHVDSDSVFSAEDVEKLVRHAEQKKFDILSGVYFTKDSRHYPLIFKKHKVKGTKKKNLYLEGRDASYLYLEELPKKRFFEADSLGFGFLLCRPEVYQALIKKHGWYFFDYKRTEWGQNCGEDLVWCERVRALGYKVMVDSEVIIGHAGGVVRFEDYKAALCRRKKEGGEKREGKV